VSAAYLVATLKLPQEGDGDMRPFVLKVGIYSEDYRNLTRLSGDTAHVQIWEYKDPKKNFGECEQALRRMIHRVPDFAWVSRWIRRVPLSVDLTYSDPDRFDGVG
jgi:hypothetical protein